MSIIEFSDKYDALLEKEPKAGEKISNFLYELYGELEKLFKQTSILHDSIEHIYIGETCNAVRNLYDQEVRRDRSGKTSIHGIGYGSLHKWVITGSCKVEKRDDQYKWTSYRCSICDQIFIHRYGTTKNIFEAMKNDHVPEKCESEATAHAKTLFKWVRDRY